MAVVKPMRVMISKGKGFIIAPNIVNMKVMSKFQEVVDTASGFGMKYQVANPNMNKAKSFT